MKDFITVHDDFMDKDWCDNVIKHFHHLLESGLGYDRQMQGYAVNQAQDNHAFFSNEGIVDMTTTKEISRNFLDKFFGEAWPEHIDGIIGADGISASIRELKCQMTKPMEGYHVWHAEQGTGASAKRCATWLLYLNDVEEGGDTEFLYQQRKVQPKAGRLVIWPAAYTHVHRGNPPMSDKYILTGWLDMD